MAWGLRGWACCIALGCSSVTLAEETLELSYPIVDTRVMRFYSATSPITPPTPGQAFYGQDAQYQHNPPSYTDNGDGTISDNVTGLMWQQEMGQKMSFKAASQKVRNFHLAGFSDWRIPTIKELYSLIQFSGRMQHKRSFAAFIDTRYFSQPLGNTQAGERFIDAQTWSATEYVGRTMRDDPTIFGVNFIDGRLKGYPKYNPRTGEPQKMYFRFVRGNPEYGKNRFVDNGDGTISDHATGLMWQKKDSQRGLNWQQALEYAEELWLAGNGDWRLPNAKELQSLVDYRRSPQISGTAAIDPLFSTSTIKDPNGQRHYPYFWSSTTHLDGRNPYSAAVYIAFGEAQGKMHGRLMDVHGAGAQRSDPKQGSRDDYPQFFGPQGDLRAVFNHVRAVRSLP